MIELTDRHYRELCADEAVRDIIDEANRHGRRAAFGFWAILLAGLVMIAAATIIAINLGHLILGVLIGSIGVLVVYIIAMIPLVAAGRAIKLPVFEILAARHGLDYAALAHAPPGYEEARLALFGGRVATESFTDLFQGKDEQGRGFATCQAYLHFENGGSFNGQLFAFDRTRPDTTVDAEAPILRDLHRHGRPRLYVGPTSILVAIAGRKGFTPGLGFRFRRGEERIRWMFGDLADSLATLSRLQTGLDQGL